MKFRKFVYERKILESDLDTLGHVNNAAYLKICEEARWEFITQNGYGLKEVKEASISPIVLKVEISYKKELFNREKIKVVSQVVEEIGLTRVKLLQEIYKEDERLSAEAIFIMSTFDLKERKVVRPPLEFLKAMGLEENREN